MTVTVLCGDVFDRLADLPDESVHCVVTSPPYWGLRDYGVAGAIGLEPTFDDHLEVMVRVFRDVRRVLRKDGTCWLNYGDAYAGSTNGRSAADTKALGKDDRTFRDKPFSTVGGVFKPKDLMMMPARVAMALQADGWWLRSEIIWHKKNPMPESTTDRPTSAHEKIYLLTRSARYFYDAEAVRTPMAKSSIQRLNQETFDQQTGGPKDPKSGNRSHRKVLENLRDKQRGHGRRHAGFNDRWDAMPREEQQANGASLRNVWKIATHPFPGAHFATFPPALVEPCIKAGTSEKGCCVECGAPWVRDIEESEDYRKQKDQLSMTRRDRDGRDRDGRDKEFGNRSFSMQGKITAQRQATGWQSPCGCDTSALLFSGPVPCIVLDPFGGSGTLGLVADRLGRHAILIELNPEYADMARNRIADDAGMFAEVAAE